MINIIAVNIKTGGGLNLLEELLFYLEENNYLNVKVYVDSKYIIKVKSKNILYIKVKGFINKIKIFSLKLNNVLYFGNLPPLIGGGKHRVLYFHNAFYLQSYYQLIKKFQFKFLLYKIYIRIYLRNIDYVFTQTKYISDLFRSFFKMETEVVPFFKRLDLNNYSSNKIKYDFCYVSLPSPAKNFNILFEALKLLNSKKYKLSIALTIPVEYTNLINKISFFDDTNIKIFNLGSISHSDALTTISQSKIFLFPSLVESYGLPLIEAAQLKKIILAPNLPYVFEVIEPSMTFNPNNHLEIVKCMINALDGDLLISKLKSTNNLSKLFKYL